MLEGTTLLILAVIIVLIILVIYATSDNVDGFWVGNDKFLELAGIYYLGAQFDSDAKKLSLIIKPTEGSDIITQTYAYEIRKNIITITHELTSDGGPILPDGDLTIEQKDDELAIVDDKTTYLILTKFEE
jgi:hypothetical protein